MRADFPGAIVVEAAQYGYEGFKNEPVAFCLHTPEEEPDDNPVTPYYFHTLHDRRASTHYFVSYLGFVFQMVPEDEGAFANARESVPGRFDWEKENWNLNLQTLSVEIEGFAHNIHETMPRGSPQWVSLIRLLAHRCKALGISPKRTFGHKEVSIYRRDPGALNIDAIEEDVEALLAPRINDEEDDMKVVQLLNDGSGKLWIFNPNTARATPLSGGHLRGLQELEKRGVITLSNERLTRDQITDMEPK